MPHMLKSHLAREYGLTPKANPAISNPQSLLPLHNRHAVGFEHDAALKLLARDQLRAAPPLLPDARGGVFH